MTAEIHDQPTPQQRHDMIAIAAYYLAEQRGFAPGGADKDWLEAEATIDAMIADHLLSRTTALEAGRRLIRNALVLSDTD
ncbi:DUF2934 domain-containing protein [Thiorhodococcus minor]|uniref:DUF2934 domain-containing protein n=1 Tax=Thiorhodococcus minor TaxID=57489 RepID=A0A6M0JYH9_9GAMM|nr:DUF2934 domain-containing protein [Thiorhodococcus minor]NEV61703.1 DUF2934 domain-containing protein [Thiorhodococcus minor]